MENQRRILGCTCPRAGSDFGAGLAEEQEAEAAEEGEADEVAADAELVVVVGAEVEHLGEAAAEADQQRNRGAGILAEPMPCSSPGTDLSSNRMVPPMTSVDTRTPMMRPICCFTGVAPTRYPVFRSCEVAPALAAAMHTIAPTISAIG